MNALQIAIIVIWSVLAYFFGLTGLLRLCNMRHLKIRYIMDFWGIMGSFVGPLFGILVAAATLGVGTYFAFIK